MNEKVLLSSIAMSPDWGNQQKFHKFAIMIQPLLSFISCVSKNEWAMNRELVESLIGPEKAAHADVHGGLPCSRLCDHSSGGQYAVSQLVFFNNLENVAIERTYHGKCASTLGEIWLILSGGIKYQSPDYEIDLNPGDLHFVPPEMLYQIEPQQNTYALFLHPHLRISGRHGLPGDESTQKAITIALSSLMQVDETDFWVPEDVSNLQWKEGERGLEEACCPGFDEEADNCPKFIRAPSTFKLGACELPKPEARMDSYHAYVVLASSMTVDTPWDKRPPKAPEQLNSGKLLPGTVVFIMDCELPARLSLTPGALLLDVPMSSGIPE